MRWSQFLTLLKIVNFTTAMHYAKIQIYLKVYVKELDFQIMQSFIKIILNGVISLIKVAEDKNIKRAVT